MDQLITIATFQYPHEVHIIKSKLEAAGIEVFLKDELTVQSHNFLSNAIGGIKLQVKASGVPMGVKLLKEMGVNVQSPEESRGYYDWIDAKTNQIPILKNWAVEFRAIFVVAFTIISALIIGGIVISISQAPSEAEKLLKEKEREKEKLENQLYDYHYPQIDSLLETNPQKAINYSKYLLRTYYPKNDNLYFDIGYGYIALDSFKLAIRYIEASITYGYSTSSKLNAIAYCQVQLNDYDAAIENYKEIARSSNEANVSIAEVHLLRKNYKDAEKYLSKYIKKKEDSHILSYRDKDLQLLKLKRDSIKSLIKD